MAKIRKRITTGRMMNLKERYDELVLEMMKLNNVHALDYYKIVKEASEIGFEVFGVRFTHQKLADDFGISRKSIGRCLALSKMNKKTEKLIDTGRISASKVLPILYTDNHNYQDEIIKKILDYKITNDQLGKSLPLFKSKKEAELWNYKNNTPITPKGNNINVIMYRRITELTFLLTADTTKMDNKDIMIKRIDGLIERLSEFIERLNDNDIEEESSDLMEDIEGAL
tara:strand:- start:2045 stop:2725 length:681 start_codon:yes stop_codon:yes gene_type:complete